MPRLIIIGASVRAAAESAMRAGYTPWCADLFADVDLKRIVPDAIRCRSDDYPGCFADILAAAPLAPWIYTGALENHPELVRRLAAQRLLWGNGPSALRACRSPFHLKAILDEAGLASPKVHDDGVDVPGSNHWLRKPLRGAAGRGIEFLREGTITPPGTHYLQEFVDGTPMSAVFVRVREEVRLLGMTEQIIGEARLNATLFQYSGNIGPVVPNESLRIELCNVGETIAFRCGLYGLFGIDFVLAGGRAWVLEVNPRYTASIEVLERSTGMCAISHHTQAFGGSPPASEELVQDSYVGRGILYAADRLVMPEGLTSRLLAEGCADVPAAGEVIESGWPILSVRSRGQSLASCREMLFDRANYFLSSLNSMSLKVTSIGPPA